MSRMHDNCEPIPPPMSAMIGKRLQSKDVATAGLIEALKLSALDDDQHYFPPYDAVPIVHSASLLRHPEIGTALGRLAGRVSAAEMRRMNYAVDGQRQDVTVVVRAFLDSLN